MGTVIKWASRTSGAMVENRLEFNSGLDAVMQLHVRKTANVKWPKVKTWPLAAKFIFSGRSEGRDGIGRFVLSQVHEADHHWAIDGLTQRVVWEIPSPFVHQLLCFGCVTNLCQREGGNTTHIPFWREPEGLIGFLTRLIRESMPTIANCLGGFHD